jgi:hypothetical protein
MELDQMVDLLMIATKTASEKTNTPMSAFGMEKEKIIADLQQTPEVIALFDEFGKLYANSTLPTVAELEELREKAVKYDKLASTPETAS